MTTTTTLGATMDYRTWLDARHEQMLRELQSDMCDLVEAGEMTADEANAWVDSAADRWARE